MKFLKEKLKGGVSLGVLITGAVTLLATLIGSYFTFASGNSAALAEETNERKKEDTEIKVNVAVLMEAVTTTKNDIRDIKVETKEILRLLK